MACSASRSAPPWRARGPRRLREVPRIGRGLGHLVVEPVVGERWRSRESFARSARKATISATIARLSVAPPFSPRLIQAWNSFSRRSRRAENCRKVSTEERPSVMTYLPAWPRSSAAARALARANSGRPARSPSSSTSAKDFSSASTFCPNWVPRLASRSLMAASRSCAGWSSGAAGAHEAGVVAVEHARLLRVQAKAVAAAVEVVDAGKERALR